MRGSGGNECYMKHFVILFKYAGQWHTSVFIRQDEDDTSDDAVRQWLIEATRSSVDYQRLRKNGVNMVSETQAFEIRSKNRPDGSGEVMLIPVPIDAVEGVQLLDEKA